MYSSPNYFIPSGGYYSSGASTQGNSGSWWSRTAYNSASAYNFNMNLTTISPQYNGNKYSGRAVRCVAQ